MLYLLYGPNSLEAIKKIREIKKEFFKKSPNFLLEEIDGDDNEACHDFLKLIENPSLFSPKRLLIFKNTISKIKNAEKFFTKYSDFLKRSKDIFLFWEQDLKKDDKIFDLLKKTAAKIQEIKEIKKDAIVSKDNSVFRFADKIFLSSGVRSLLHLENARIAGVDAKNLINVIFWKIKKTPQKDIHLLDLAYKSIIADLNLKIDSRSEGEHLSRLAISIASKVSI